MNSSADRYCSRSSRTRDNEEIHRTPKSYCGDAFRFRPIHTPTMSGIVVMVVAFVVTVVNNVVTMHSGMDMVMMVIEILRK
jgi:hypothetical protein